VPRDKQANLAIIEKYLYFNFYSVWLLVVFILRVKFTYVPTAAHELIAICFPETSEA
jgi:hypothetical protein